MHVTLPLKRRTSGGFTLLELAMVMIIFGMMLVGFLGLYSTYTQQIQLEKSERTIAHARQSLISYKTIKGKYPCPARTGLNVTDPNFGVADCTITPVSGVLHGLVPNMESSSSTRDSLLTSFTDPWGQKLYYAVTLDLSEANSNAFDSKAGTISVVDEYNKPTGGIQTGSLAHFVTWSMGNDTQCTSGTLDEENCNGDNTFRDSIRYDGDTAKKYDDYIAYYNRADIRIWANHTPGGAASQGDAKNENSGNIGIGVTSPTEKLDVAGNIMATDYSLSDLICKDGTTTCMKPEALFSITCPQNKQYIKSVTINSNGTISPACDFATFPAVFTQFYIGGVSIGSGGCPQGVKYILTDGKVMCH